MDKWKATVTEGGCELHMLMPDERHRGFWECESDKEESCTEPVVIFENVELQEVAEVRREGCNIYIKLPETICATCRKPCETDDEPSETN